MSCFVSLSSSVCVCVYICVYVHVDIMSVYFLKLSVVHVSKNE